MMCVILNAAFSRSRMKRVLTMSEPNRFFLLLFTYNENYDKDEKDDNTLHPRTERKQGCKNHTEEPLLSEDSNDEHDDNDHNDQYSESSDDESKKKKIPRRTPKSTIRIPKKTHWSGNPLLAAQEKAAFLVTIGATCNFAKFMAANGLDEIAKIQQLTR